MHIVLKKPKGICHDKSTTSAKTLTPCAENDLRALSLLCRLCRAVLRVAILGLSARSARKTVSELPVSVTVPLFGESAGSPPQTYAKAACLIDGKSGAVLYEKNSSAALPMASTTKIMTALVVLEHLPHRYGRYRSQGGDACRRLVHLPA